MRLSRFLGIAALFVVMGCAAALLMREGLLNWWLQNRLASHLAAELGTKVHLEDVRYRQGALLVDRCRLDGPRPIVESADLRGIKTTIDWQELISPSGKNLQVEIESAEIIRGNADQAGREAGRGNSFGIGGKSPGLQMSVGRLTLRQEGQILPVLKDVALQATHDGGIWSFSARGGDISLLGLPMLALDRLAGDYRGGELTIGAFGARNPRGGTLAGSATERNGHWSGQFRWQDLAVQEIAPSEIGAHFAGRCSGEAQFEGEDLRGKMTITGAEARGLPSLIRMASLFAGEDWSSVPWSSFTFDFARNADASVDFSNLLAESPKGLAVKGSGRVGSDQLDAELSLGVIRKGRPWLVAFMPILFRSESDGYLWTPVRMGGTPKMPTEDLTPRVVAALAAVPAAGAVEAATIIPGNAVEAATGLLRGLLKP